MERGNRGGQGIGKRDLLIEVDTKAYYISEHSHNLVVKNINEEYENIYLNIVEEKS